MFDYILLKNAEKFLLKLPQNEQIRIIQALDSLHNNVTNLDIKKLKGRLEFRLRVGKYRILFIEDTDNNLYVITTIGSRGDVYK
ncbi:type II toxin-antitoxin system RelE family toxin [Cyanobacterium sp. Dongsha4]|uniref:type II toxin-antitoxin system RelE family toxin n=1 Tax=Cyanobacterium sp. DS4 TaxID=2878255 RepID=UPI002E7FBB1B|nr:type II toxin-antitoxin system RelE/ParE family toxin [Cyanobacterium sp. Dongsha4]WVL01952.1 type II toxin-antitoxin system RelE/ParE family toxin [Cyanobacterium sp. Dongsha4]